jgi:hypothetical protein
MLRLGFLSTLALLCASLVMCWMNISYGSEAWAQMSGGRVHEFEFTHALAWRTYGCHTHDKGGIGGAFSNISVLRDDLFHL